MALQYCYECGKSISTSAPACPHCGAPAKGVGGGGTRTKSPKSRSTAIVLALFLGGLGAHWFYLEQPGRGLRYALFCWTFLPLLFAIVTTFQFLAMTDEAFQRRYG